MGRCRGKADGRRRAKLVKEALSRLTKIVLVRGHYMMEIGDEDIQDVKAGFPLLSRARLDRIRQIQ